MKDQLGDRMKTYYEDRTRFFLPRRAYTIIRIDGKAFHTYTRGLDRPFDQGLIDDMDATAMYLCKNIQGAKMGYVQSDEISILITDFDTIETDMWFDGNLQKMCSVSASLATAEFNRLRMKRFCIEKYKELPFESIFEQKIATFDARVFQIPSRTEVENYFVWRQKDATRNSISSVAQSLYSHKELNGKSTDQMQEMIFQKGINWNDYTVRQKRGGLIVKVTEEWVRERGAKEAGVLLRNHPEKGDIFSDLAYGNPDGGINKWETYTRSVWKTVDCPIFTQDKGISKIYIPENN